MEVDTLFLENSLYSDSSMFFIYIPTAICCLGFIGNSLLTGCDILVSMKICTCSEETETCDGQFSYCFSIGGEETCL